MQDFPTKTDGVSTEPAAEYNNLASELKTNVTSWGNGLNAGLTNQLAEIITIGGQTATIYSDGGAADTYVLASIPVTRIEPTSYFNGQTVRFLPANTNTGASTVNVSGLGATAVKQEDGTTDVTAGQITAAEFSTFVFDGTAFRIQPLGSSAATGKVIQEVSVATGAVFTTTALITQDDTIPQNTEGLEVLTLAITPTNASSTLYIEAHTVMSHSAGGNNSVHMPIFKDSIANSVAVISDTSSGSGSMACLSLNHTIPAGSTSSQTFKMRIGSNVAGTVTVNGFGGARKFGGVYSTTLNITEVLP